jgi:hypothetical protein
VISDHVPERLTRVVADPLHRWFASFVNDDEVGQSVVYRADGEYALLVDVDEREIGRLEAYAESTIVIMALAPAVWGMGALMIFDGAHPWLTVAAATLTLLSLVLPFAAMGDLGDVEVTNLAQGGDGS